jgi:hypothetical protein
MSNCFTIVGNGRCVGVLVFSEFVVVGTKNSWWDVLLGGRDGVVVWSRESIEPKDIIYYVLGRIEPVSHRVLIEQSSSVIS